MFNQTQVIWRYLSGDPAAKKEFPLTEQVVAFWLDRWTAGLPPDELKLADGVRGIEKDIRAVAARVFKLHDAGRHDAAAVLARQELVERLQPALAEVNREIYRRAREFSVQAAFTRSEEHTSELQSHSDLVCRLLLEKKKPEVTRRSATTQ